MTVGGRITLGSTLLICLLASALLYESITIARLAETQREVSQRLLPSTLVALDLVTVTEHMQDCVLKYEVTGDHEYASELLKGTDRVEAVLSSLRQLKERETSAEFDAISEIWRQFPSPLIRSADGSGGPTDPDPAELKRQLVPLLRQLNEAVSAFVASGRRAADSYVLNAQQSMEHAHLVALAVFGVSILLGVVIIIATVRSIRRPLRRLARATRAIADGRFDHHVAIEGNDELSELAHQFNRMAARLAELDQMKKDFFSFVSHEIKTPLAAMAETSQVMLDGLTGDLSKQQQSLIQLQKDNVERLQHMIGELIELSRFEAGVMEYDFAPTDIGELVQVAREQFAALYQSRGVNLVAEAQDNLGRATVDRDRLLQVLHNLLSNALRVSPESSTVNIVARIVVFSDVRWLRLVVADRGSGIADEHKELLFRRFHRISNRQIRDRHGLGLGLSICRDIVIAHDGRIFVEDTPGGGATFVVEVPLAGPGPAGSAGPIRREETA